MSAIYCPLAAGLLGHTFITAMMELDREAFWFFLFVLSNKVFEVKSIRKKCTRTHHFRLNREGETLSPDSIPWRHRARSTFPLTF